MKGQSRKFFRQTITVVVLSEVVPLEWDDLGDVNYAIQDGDCVGVYEENSLEELTAEQMRQALLEAGSEPGFFQLDEDEGVDDGAE